MVICQHCGQEMKTAKSCNINGIVIDGQIFVRDTSYLDIGKRCHDCGIVNDVGNIHHYGCDMERCPKCGNQLISCNCHKEKLVELEINVKTEIIFEG